MPLFDERHEQAAISSFPFAAFAHVDGLAVPPADGAWLQLLSRVSICEVGLRGDRMLPRALDISARVATTECDGDEFFGED